MVFSDYFFIEIFKFLLNLFIFLIKTFDYVELP